MVFYVASSNAGKLRDFRAAAREFADLELKPLPGLPSMAPPPEEEPDFEGNARVKAVYYSLRAPGAWVIADDSGLEVDALEGRPGVRSARFALDSGMRVENADAANNAALLAALADTADRSARYRCVLALARTGVVEQIATGVLEGEILRVPAGDAGFGYDPLFWSSELDCSMAEADVESRMRVSHRGRALRSLLRQENGIADQLGPNSVIVHDGR